jgi:DNA-3-methyladenine glycosylase
LKKLPLEFYNRGDVAQIARELLGKIIVTNFSGKITSGRIVETEAYLSLNDKASHAFDGRRTQRNEPMYAEGGTAYVYICYGLHHLFNVVTNKKDIPEAVLIRAIEPIQGIGLMLQRAGKLKNDNTISKGPGNVSKVLGIDKFYSGLSLLGRQIYIADDGYILNQIKIGTSKRIGIEGAGESAQFLLRFYVKENPFVSGSPVK